MSYTPTHIEDVYYYIAQQCAFYWTYVGFPAMVCIYTETECYYLEMLKAAGCPVVNSQVHCYYSHISR